MKWYLGAVAAVLFLTAQPLRGSGRQWYAEKFDNDEFKVFGFTRNGDRIGLWTWRYRDGQTRRKVRYKDGLRQGPFKSWYKNGRPKETGTYRDDKLHGRYRKFSARTEGRVLEKYFYVNGIPEGTNRTFHENGRLALVSRYSQKRRAGRWVMYYDNGKKEWMLGYDDQGKLDGMSVGWYKNGQVKYERQWAHGKKIGVWRTYDRKGNLTSRAVHQRTPERKDSVWRRVLRRLRTLWRKVRL